MPEALGVWQTMAEAWAHYKARHDPPGMQVMSFRARGLGLPDPTARAAAWARHDRRHALLDKMERLAGTRSALAWPNLLAMADDDVARLEAEYR